MFQKERSRREVVFWKFAFNQTNHRFQTWEKAKFLKRDRNLLVKDKSFATSLCMKKKCNAKRLDWLRLFLILAEEAFAVWVLLLRFFVNLRRHRNTGETFLFFLKSIGYVLLCFIVFKFILSIKKRVFCDCYCRFLQME